MWLSLILLLLILAVTYVQSTQGLFSAMVMMVLTICCAAAAIGTYEWIALHWIAPLWKPNMGFPLALGVAFGVPLVVLRIALDRAVRRAPLLPGWVDRIGGGFCGFITAMSLVGVAAHTLQNIPFGPSVIGFSRVDVPARERQGDGPEPQPVDINAPESDLWLKPDRFAVGMVSVLSAGVFSGEDLLALDQPDLVQAVGWVNAVPVEVSRVAQPGSVSIARTSTVPFVYDFKPPPLRSEQPPTYEPVEPKSGHEFRLLRVTLKDGARDERKSHVFSPRQFRLVGSLSSGRLAQFRPVAIQQEDASQSTNRHIRSRFRGNARWHVVDDLFFPRDDNNNQVEVVYELPSGFKPQFLEYKRGARTTVSFDKSESTAAAQDVGSSAPAPPGGSAAAPPSGGTSGSGESAPDTSGRRRRGSSGSDTGGGSRGAAAQPTGSFFGDQLPMPMKSYRRINGPMLERGKLAGGHIAGKVDEQAGGSDPEISQFDVPSEKRLLQLNVARLQARSGLGRALDFARSTAQNYTVKDSQGNRYVIVGKAAIATVDGQRHIEVQYFPEDTGSVGGLGPFDKIKERDITGDAELLLLFHVNPGATIVSFSTGGTATREDDLTDQNLTAPN